MFKRIIEFLETYSEKTGISEQTAVIIAAVVSVIVLLLISWVAYVLTWKIMRKIILPIIQKSRTSFDDLLLKHRFFKRLAYFVPALLLYYLVDDALGVKPEQIPKIIFKLLDGWIVVISILIFNSLLSTIRDYYQRYSISKERPIDSFIQVLRIISYIIAGLFVIGIFVDKDITSLLLGMGTMSAVLMLIFRDPILGFVGGLQLTFNSMVRIGDWISVPKFDADGVVLEITLTVVKVQNWDKTISMVPTYALVTNSFQNWRGMEESGGRRIKRSLNIDMDSVRFCTPEMLEEYGNIQILKPYLERKEKEIEQYNKKNNIDPSVFVNGRRQTNLGVFRAYLKAYLKKRVDINQNMTFLVRHLQPTEKGLPVEVYVFTKTTEWGDYENIQADIFDHILAAIPQFHLKVYQYPSNSGILELLGKG